MIVLIGEQDSKRTQYIKKAAGDLGAPLEMVSWDALFQEIDLGQFKGAAVKIDPPSYQTVRLCQMQAHLEKYRNILSELAQADCRFLNTPEAVCRLLDKRETKRRLMEKGIPATQMFCEEIRTVGQLTEVMKQRRCYSVFVKPRFFSGAAGVAAFRLHPVRGSMKLYTSCHLEDGELLNTKRIFSMDNREEICRLLDRLLTLDCVVERWYPKASFQGKSFDLRVVFQLGHVAHVVVRQSKGPITNLHLNNQAMDIRALGLGEDTAQEVARVCGQACAAFPGVSMAGIDILLEKDTGSPLVIEMNGQGDLIYQDIYGENRIYQEQVRWLWESSADMVQR